MLLSSCRSKRNYPVVLIWSDVRPLGPSVSGWHDPAAVFGSLWKNAQPSVQGQRGWQPKLCVASSYSWFFSVPETWTSSSSSVFPLLRCDSSNRNEELIVGASSTQATQSIVVVAEWWADKNCHSLDCIEGKQSVMVRTQIKDSKSPVFLVFIKSP